MLQERGREKKIKLQVYRSYIEASCVFRVGGEVEQEAAKLCPQTEVA